VVLSTEFGMFRGCSQDSEARSYSYAYPHYIKCDESSYCQDKGPAKAKVAPEALSIGRRSRASFPARPA
jgi:hypothetical protein